MPRKAKTETIVTENVELKEEQIQTPEAPGHMEAASKETSPETEENPDKLEDAGKSDGIAATESSEAGAADEHHPDSGMIPTIEQDADRDEKEPTPPAKAASPEQTEENIQHPVPARNRPASPAPAKRQASPSILTLNADSEVETQESREDIIWHELQNAYRTRKILTGNLGGIERMEGGGTIAVIYYKEMRVVIPLAEMMINLVEDESHDYGELVLRQNKILGNMLGCEIDFIVKGLDNSSRSVVASRKDAMYKKRQIFYLPDASGNSRVCEDRIVQARVIAVAEKVVRVEIFGTECSILARDLSWDWLGDATECFHVGDQILVRILSVKIRSLEDISVRADVKSVNGNTSKANLGKCKIQGKYAGTVTDIHKGTVFVRLQIGVNAIAHSCYDSRMPGKKDDVSFVVTRIDEERNVAVGLISRIIRQNI